jgi:hypothetical protein
MDDNPRAPACSVRSQRQLVRAVRFSGRLNLARLEEDFADLTFDRVGGSIMIGQEFDQNIICPERSQCLCCAASHLKEAAPVSLEC